MTPLALIQKRAQKAAALKCAQKALVYRGNAYCQGFVNAKPLHGLAVYRGVRYEF